jgi:hypothetical protein
VKQIESDLLANNRQVSRLHLSDATWHHTTHLIVFPISHRVPPPTVNFGLNATVIGSRNVQRRTSSSTLVSPEVPSYCLWWLGPDIRPLHTSHPAATHLSSCNTPRTVVIKYFIHNCKAGNIRHWALQLREITWRTALLIRYFSNITWCT